MWLGNPSLTLSERIFTCQECGLVIDRDVNAAVNLKQLL
ncbi:zinc ribbon domain-containing protein [Frankia sp. CiP3]